MSATISLKEAVSRACQEPTLTAALAWMAVWECERAIAQAREFDKTGIATGSNGAGWDTCFRVSFEALMEAWPPRQGMNDENCKHPVKKYKNMEDRTVGGYTCSLCGKVVVFTEKEKEDRERVRTESHPEEDEPAFPIQGHIEKDYEYDTEVERLRGEKPGVTLLEHYALMCPLRWDGFDRRDDEVQRGNSLRIHAELRLEWARAMLHVLRPVKDEGGKA